MERIKGTTNPHQIGIREKIRIVILIWFRIKWLELFFFEWNFEVFVPLLHGGTSKIEMKHETNFCEKNKNLNEMSYSSILKMNRHWYARFKKNNKLFNKKSVCVYMCEYVWYVGGFSFFISFLFSIEEEIIEMSWVYYHFSL